MDNIKPEIEKLGLSVRAYNALCRAGILTIRQLCAINRKDLRKLRNMGAKTVAEVEEKLEAYIASGVEKMENPPECPFEENYFESDYKRGFQEGVRLFRNAVVQMLKKREKLHERSIFGVLEADIRQIVEHLEVP